jgi:glutamate-1-semialdehyde 2,1-aminomutase
MAAALANLKEMKKINAPQVMLEKGKKLLDGLADIANGYGYDLKVTGAPSMPYLRITNDETLMLHQDWCAESTKRGAFFTSHHNWFISAAHTDADIKKTWAIADDAFKVVRKKHGK